MRGLVILSLAFTFSFCLPSLSIDDLMRRIKSDPLSQLKSIFADLSQLESQGRDIARFLQTGNPLHLYSLFRGAEEMGVKLGVIIKEIGISNDPQMREETVLFLLPLIAPTEKSLVRKTAVILP